MYRDGSAAKAWTLSLALVLAAAPALAGNDDEILVGNGAALVGGAVVCTVRDGSSVWYNPAGIGGTTRSQLDASTSVYSLRMYSAPGFLRTPQGESQDLAVKEFVTVPVQISFVRPLSDAITVGLGYFQPRATRLIANVRFDTHAGDYPSTWTVDGISEYSEYVFGAALGFVPSATLRFGVGGLLRWDSLTESVTVFGMVRDGDAARHTVQVGQLRTQDLFGVEPTAGVQWDVTPRLTLGLNVRGPRLGLHNQGTTSSQTSLGTTVTTPAMLDAASETDGVASAAMSWLRLGRYYGGASYRWNAVKLNVEGDIQPGWSNPGASIARHFTWNARVGATYDATKAVTLGVGLFTDRAATDETEGSLVGQRTDFYGGSVGVRFSNEHLLAASEPVDSLIFTTVFALRYAHANSTSEAMIVDPSQDDILELLDVNETALDINELAFYVGGGLAF